MKNKSIERFFREKKGKTMQEIITFCNGDAWEANKMQTEILNTGNYYLDKNHKIFKK